MAGFFERVWCVVAHIPKGRVSTYGAVAALAGNPRCARQVGYALHANPSPGAIPCHRVVFADGRLAPGFAFGGLDAQRELLEDEGILVSDGKSIDIRRYEWLPTEAEESVLQQALAHLQ